MDVLQFHFLFPPKKCAMRSSSIESNNTTIYNRPILCNSQEQLGEFFFFLFCEVVMPILRVQRLATQDTEMHFARLGKRKKKTKILEKKQQHGGVRKSKSYKPQWDYRRRNKLLNTV